MSTERKNTFTFFGTRSQRFAKTVFLLFFLTINIILIVITQTNLNEKRNDHELGDIKTNFASNPDEIQREADVKNKFLNGVKKETSKISTHNSTSIEKPQSTGPRKKILLDALKEWPHWNNVIKANHNGDKESLKNYSHDMTELLFPYLALDPPHLNKSCLEPPAPLENIDCSADSEAFHGRRKKPAKLGVLLQLGADIDSLEIHLRESFDLVDKYFIIESMVSHHPSKFQKPMTWENIKHTPRFSRFNHKVVHFVMDESDVVDAREGELFKFEHLQEKLRWQKFLKWNRATKFFKDDDVIGFGDADEIPSRVNIQKLKTCQMAVSSVDIGIWFVWGHLSHSFVTDFPVRGHPFSYGDPTFYTVASATKEWDTTNKFPTRKRGRSPAFLLGGSHLTGHEYLAFTMIKEVTATEYGWSQQKIKKIQKFLDRNDIQGLVKNWNDFSSLAQRFFETSSVIDKIKPIAYVPWFLNCQKDRFPTWFERPDPRLTIPI